MKKLSMSFRQLRGLPLTSHKLLPPFLCSDISLIFVDVKASKKTVEDWLSIAGQSSEGC